MRARSARFDKAIVGSNKLATRVDILLNRQIVPGLGGEGARGLNIDGGQVTLDRTLPIMGRAVLTVAEPTRLPTVEAGGPLSPYGYEAQIWRGVQYADGTQELLPLGVFGIQRSVFPGTLIGELDLFDRSQQVADALIEDDYVIAGGTNTATAIRALIDAGVPGLTYAFQTTPYVTPPVLFGAGTNRWDAARALARSVGCEVFFDGHGRCVLRDEPRAQAEPVIRFVEGDGGTLLTASLVLDRTPTFNRQIVSGENSSNLQVYRAVATDDDPASPTNYYGQFGRKPAPIHVDEFITSEEQARTVAAALLRAKSGIGRTLELTAVPNPALEPGDIALGERSALGVNELYIVDRFTIGLRAKDTVGLSGIDIWRNLVTVKARFIRAVAADVPVDPVDTLLWDENFDDAVDGGDVSILSTTATSVGGTAGATLSHSSANSVEGGLSLKIDGTDAEWAKKTFAAVADFHAMYYYTHVATPGETAIVHNLYAADGSTVAGRIGVTDEGRPYLQDGTAGEVGGSSGVLTDGMGGVLTDGMGQPLTDGIGTAPAFTIGGLYVAEYTVARGVQTVRFWPRAKINSLAAADAFATVTAPITELSYAAVAIGLLDDIASGSGITGDIADQNFDGGTNGAPATATTMPGWTFSGSGGMWHSTAHSVEGGMSLWVQPTAGTSHMARKGGTSAVTEFWDQVYAYVDVLPTGTNTAYFLQGRNGSNTGAASQVGLKVDGKLRIRDSNNGVSGAQDESTAALPIGAEYRITRHLVGAVPPALGTMTVRYYTGANLNSTNTADAVDTLTCTISATDFADPQIGLIQAATDVSIYLDRYQASSVGPPSPIGAGGGAPLTAHIDRYQARSDRMPTRLVVDDGGAVSPTLEPPDGKVWFGATTGTTGVQSGSTPAGLTTYMGFAGKRPHILHFYIAGWNGTFSSQQLAMLNPAGGPRAIPFVAMKPRNDLSYAQIAAGGANAVLNTFVTNVMAYPHKVFVTCYHEPENDTPRGTAGYTDADYVAMWRHIVTYCRGRGLQPASQGGNVVWVWNMMGYSGWTADLDDLFPGEDVVDWLGFDNYAHDPDPRFEDIVLEDDVGASFWSWTQASHPSMPVMLAEWGKNKNVGGTPAGSTDAVIAAFFDTVVEDLPQFEQLKALVYWNSRDAGIYEVQGNPLAEAAFGEMVANTVFDIDMSEVP